MSRALPAVREIVLVSAAVLPGRGRRAVASLWAAAILPHVVVALWAPVARALGLLASVPLPAVVVLGVIAGPVLVAWRPRWAARLPESLDDWLDPPNRAWAVLWAAGGALSVLLLGRMALFLADPGYVSGSLIPSDTFLVRHSCLTAYVHGAILSQDPSANVYDLAFVEAAGTVSPPLPPTAAHFAPFTLDAFGYPPPFLLLPRALLLLSTNFFSQRVLFGSASLGLLFYACAAAARTLGGVAERRLWLLTPLFLAMPAVLITIQVGNFHLATLALCLLCWVALEKRQDGLAGALLAAATLAKIFPGLLGVLLLVQRRWRAVAFTCLAAVALCALSVAVLGTRVWRDFLFYQLPNIQSGEALRFLAGTRREIAYNIAPFGLPFKLRELGFEGLGWAQARLFGNVYTLIVLVLAALAGRRKGRAQFRLTVWLALVMLGSLRSPYAAPFVVSTVVVLFLVLAAEVRSRRGLAAFLAAGAFVTSAMPFSEPRVLLTASLVQVGALYALLVWAVVRKEPLEEGA